LLQFAVYVVVAKDGSAYVVDREAPNVYKIALDADGKPQDPVLFATDPMLKGTIAGQNAVVLLPDESALLTVVYTPPALVRIDLATQAVTKVTLHGPFKDDAPLSGADGMDVRNGSVYVAFSSKLVRAIPRAADWAEADTTSTDIAAGMTGVINTPDGLFLLNGQSIRFALKQETDPFQLVRYLGLL
jgi:sugar lactone lactonase YvrE